MTQTVTVYSRPGCHLCDVAIEQIAAISQPEFRLEVIDIEGDDTLFRDYLERIPVIELDGEELYEFHVDASDLARRLKAGSGR